MKFKNIQLLERVQANYLFYPLVFSVVLLVLLAISLFTDLSLSKHLGGYKSLKFSHEAINLLFSTIITSSITITSVILSITVLTLSLASNQLGPRLLPNFISHGNTQLVIGAFTGIYIYSLMLLIVSNNAYFHDRPLFISLYLGIALAILSFIILIYFIHHVCQAIQVNNVIKMLSRQTLATMEPQFQPTQKLLKVHHPGQQNLTNAKAVYSKEKGYIQTIDMDDIKNLATEKKCIIKLLKRPGHFILKGEEIAQLYGLENTGESSESSFSQVKDQLLKLIRLGPHRTIIQDVEYGFEQITEIAIKALSPGINNPYTAINCIRELAYLYSELGKLSLPLNRLMDDENNLRVIFVPYTYEGFVKIALDPIRQNLQHHVSVIIELLKMFRQIQLMALQKPLLAALCEQASLIVSSSQKQHIASSDLKDIEKAYQLLLQND